jgi:DNA-binding PadR family transcriptional regulator
MDESGSSMRSPVGWALLGLLIERPGYGYDLVQRFERTYGDALELSSPSQIYTALKGLEQRSLIEQLPAEGGADALRQPKPRYRATPEGRRRYQEQLISQVHEERRRSRLFARQLAILDPHAALTVIERYEESCLQEPTRARSERSLSSAGASVSASASAFASRLIAEEARLATGTTLQWIEYARRELEAIIDAQDGQDSGR